MRGQREPWPARLIHRKYSREGTAGNRYELPDPKCNHRPVNRVTAGVLGGTGPQASTYVCDREACIEDAKAWAYASTHLVPEVVVLPNRTN